MRFTQPFKKELVYTKKQISFAILILGICLAFLACTNNSSSKNTLWENAMYTEDAELGTGSKTINVKVIVEDKSVSFKINTNKKTVGDALLEHKLISGEKGAYGLYVKFVNGIEADYSKNKSFWSFCKNGESLMTGVDGEIIANGNHYELIYTKQ